MVRGDRRRPRPFRSRLIRWREVPGGFDTDGREVTEPGELTEARFILRLCERFGCLPSELLAEDAALMRLLTIEQLGTPREEEPNGE